VGKVLLSGAPPPNPRLRDKSLKNPLFYSSGFAPNPDPRENSLGNPMFLETQNYKKFSSFSA
jgi:hypothetical protein